jgi:hypothetical protein
MSPITASRLLFAIAAVYDGVLGLLFLIFPTTVFGWFNVAPPNHPGYVQFPAALLIIFALIFLDIARDPVRRRSLIIYGILLKISYSGLVFFYWATAGVPDMWKPFAFADLLFLLLFVWAAYRLRSVSADAAA